MLYKSSILWYFVTAAEKTSINVGAGKQGATNTKTCESGLGTGNGERLEEF